MAWISLLIAALLTADPPPRVDVWSMVIGTRLSGAPHVDVFTAAQWDADKVLPCASQAQIRAAMEATIPPKIADLGSYEPVTRGLVVTVLDRRGRALCSRVVPATIDEPIEAPPSADGKVGFSWSVIRRDPTGIAIGIPRRCNAVALRVSGWRGIETATFAIADLQRRFDPAGEPCR